MHRKETDKMAIWQDTTRVQQQDTTIVPINATADSTPQSEQLAEPVVTEQETSVTPEPVIKVTRERPEPVQQAAVRETTPLLIVPEVKEELVQDTIPVTAAQETSYPLYSLFPSLNEKDSAQVHLSSKLPTSFTVSRGVSYTGPQAINSHTIFEKGWILGIALFSLVLFLLIKIYFQKYLSSVVTSAVNIQIAEKLMREKNVMVRRMFALLNLNFAISVSLFIYILLSRFDLPLIEEHKFFSFLILFGILGIVLFLRYLIITIIGSTFDSGRLFREYLHNTYLINKNLGLYLLPLTISVFFIAPPLNNIAFYICLVIVSISLIYKYIRGVQILMKYNVFLFYTILYLCTLEIIPALVGIKFVLSLR